VPDEMMTTVLAAMWSAFWHVPMSVMPAAEAELSGEFVPVPLRHLGHDGRPAADGAAAVEA